MEAYHWLLTVYDNSHSDYIIQTTLRVRFWKTMAEDSVPFVLFHFVWGHMFARNDVGVQESLSKVLNQATFHIAIPLATFPYLPPPWFVDVAWRRTTCVHLSWHYQKNTRSSTTLFQQRALDPCHIYDTRRSAAPHIKKLLRFTSDIQYTTSTLMRFFVKW